MVGVTGEELQKWCTFFGHPLYFVSAGRLLAYYEPAQQAGRIISCYSLDGHGYIYKDGRALKSYRSDAPRSERTVLDHEKKKQLTPWTDQKFYNGTPEPGLFYVYDLAFTRAHLLERGRNPKVSLRDFATLGQLTYHCVEAVDGCTGICRIQEEPPHASEIVQWLQNLPLEIEYDGSRLPAIALRVFLALLKAKRRTPSTEEQRQLLELHDNRCAMCGEVFDGDLEWDHVAPLRQISRLAPQRFQPICASCHEEKTALEGQQDRTLKSCFSKHAWDAYVQSPRPPPLVWSPHEAKETKAFLSWTSGGAAATPWRTMPTILLSSVPMTALCLPRLASCAIFRS